jgi:hypothetical protein
MFDSLSEKLESVFKKLRGQGVMTEENIKEALREVRPQTRGCHDLTIREQFQLIKEYV